MTGPECLYLYSSWHCVASGFLEVYMELLCTASPVASGASLLHFVSYNCCRKAFLAVCMLHLTWQHQIVFPKPSFSFTAIYKFPLIPILLTFGLFDFSEDLFCERWIFFHLRGFQSVWERCSRCQALPCECNHFSVFSYAFFHICQFSHYLGMGSASPFREESTNDLVKENTGLLLSCTKRRFPICKTDPCLYTGGRKDVSLVVSVLDITTAQVLMVGLCQILLSIFLPLEALRLAFWGKEWERGKGRFENRRRRSLFLTTFKYVCYPQK